MYYLDSRRKQLPVITLDMLPRSTMLFAILPVFATSGCTTQESAGPALIATRSWRGDTLVVTQLSGQVCGATGILREDMRIGRADGPDEYLFGRVLAMAARGDGPVYVYDDQIHALRLYDRNGAFVRNIGRRGSGPGEYQYIIGLALLDDGRLATWDVRGHRINMYRGDGEPLDDILVTLGQMQFIDKAFAVDTADTYYVLTWGAGRLRMLHFDDGGRVRDTLWYPRGQPFLGTRGVHPRLVATFHPHGHFVHGTSDRYAVHLRTPEGVPLTIERTVAPLPFADEERAQLQARLDWNARSTPVADRPRGEFATVPSAKPFFTDVLVGRDGTIWVLRELASRPRVSIQATRRDSEPQVTWSADREFDVFAPDGRYYGRVPAPEHATIRVIDGTTLWGVVRDDDGVESIVRYRLTDFCNQ